MEDDRQRRSRLRDPLHVVRDLLHLVQGELPGGQPQPRAPEKGTHRRQTEMRMLLEVGNAQGQACQRWGQVWDWERVGLGSLPALGNRERRTETPALALEACDDRLGNQ